MSDAEATEHIPFAAGTQVFVTERTVRGEPLLDANAALPGLKYVVVGFHSFVPDEDDPDQNDEEAYSWYLLEVADGPVRRVFSADAKYVRLYRPFTDKEGSKTWNLTITEGDLGWLAQHFHENADGLTHAGVHDKPRVIKALASVFDALAERGAEA